jgi:1,5-anhydro-D-fructose reductase (1,5-anhydro-D-mannitol-forming)
MVRWGIIGLGRIADTEIAPAITASPRGELRGVVSRDQGRAEAFAGRHGAARALTSFGELLADPGVDAVYIATPNALHADEVVAAAAAGKHVMCDKPLALAVADARRAVAACEEAAVQLGITFQTRFHDHFGRFRG